MFVFKVNNQLKDTNTCLLRKYVFIVNFPIFTTLLSNITSPPSLPTTMSSSSSLLSCTRCRDHVHTMSFSIVFILFQIIKPLFSTPVALSEDAEHHKKLGKRHRIHMASRWLCCFCFIVYSGQNVRSFISNLTISVIRSSDKNVGNFIPLIAWKLSQLKNCFFLTYFNYPKVSNPRK